MSRGKFIAIEGGEGSGKTTCIDYLREALHGTDTIFTREPGGTIVAEKIRSLIFSQDPAEAMEAETELLLFFAARIQHIKKLILPKLEAGVNVISDRFSVSTYAYQIIARGRRDLEDTFALLDTFARGGVVRERQWHGAIEPDLYVLLEVDPVVGLRRAKSRGDLNRFDNETVEFHTRVADGLRRGVCGKRHAVIVDANAPQDEVRREVLAHIKNVLGMK